MTGRRMDVDHHGTFTHDRGATHFIRVGEFELQVSLSAKGYRLRVFVDNREVS
jgi:hypothetical protein